MIYKINRVLSCNRFESLSQGLFKGFQGTRFLSPDHLLSFWEGLLNGVELRRVGWGKQVGYRVALHTLLDALGVVRWKVVHDERLALRQQGQPIGFQIRDYYLGGECPSVPVFRREALSGQHREHAASFARRGGLGSVNALAATGSAVGQGGVQATARFVQVQAVFRWDGLYLVDIVVFFGLVRSAAGVGVVECFCLRR